MIDDPRPRWSEVESALARYSPGLLEVRLRQWMEEFLPRPVQKAKGRYELPDLELYQRRIDLLLSREVGAWYGHRAWRAGNESFGGCFCHSFVHELASEARPEGVRRAAAWVTTEVGALARCLREFGQIYAQFPRGGDPGERAVALSFAIDQVFQVVIDATSCVGVWQPYVADGVAWLFDQRGFEVPAVLMDSIDYSVDALCADATAPPPRERWRLCDDLAGIVVLASTDGAP